MLTQIFGGISAIGGLLGAQGAARRAQQERQAILSQMELEAKGNYLDDQGQNTRTLQREAGLGADAIRSLGANLGGSLASAGVYNSSAVAGAMGNAQRDTQSAIADLASRLQASALDRRQQALQRVRGLQLGVAGENYSNRQNDLQTARGGLQSYLGNLVQSNLLRSGANAPRAATPPIVNGTINQGPNLPGNAGISTGWREMIQGSMNLAQPHVNFPIYKPDQGKPDFWSSGFMNPTESSKKTAYKDPWGGQYFRK